MAVGSDLRADRQGRQRGSPRAIHRGLLERPAPPRTECTDVLDDLELIPGVRAMALSPGLTREMD